MRTTMLFVPGISPGMIQNAGILGADSIIFDLEDSVPYDEKDAARILVRNALQSLDYGSCERMIRINSTDYTDWQLDIRESIKSMPDAYVIPKTENETMILEVERVIDESDRDTTFIDIIPLIENARGVECCDKILNSSSRIRTVLFGAEDYATDIGATRTKEGIEIAYARSRIVNAAAAAGIEAIDTPFVDVEDIDGLKKDSITARNMGFKGKALISPKHCMIVKNVFTPSPEEVENALRIIAATKQAKQQGKGAIRVDGKMIDAPIVKRALDILKKANIDGDFYE